MTKPAAKGTRRQKQKEETRGIILDAARSLFSELGFTKTTIRKIAREAGVGFGTVFNHFPDKSSLLMAALLNDLKETQEVAMATFPLDAPVCEQFLYLSKQFYNYYAKNTNLSRTLIKEMWFVRGEWGDAFKEQSDQYLSLLTNIFEEGKKRGEIKKDVVSYIAAGSFFSHYYSVLLMGLSGEEFKPDDLIFILTMMIDHTMKGIGATK